MNGKGSWGIIIFNGAVAVIVAAGSVIMGMFNGKIKTVDKRVEREEEGRKEENKQQWEKINTMQTTVTETKVVVDLMAKKMGVID